MSAKDHRPSPLKLDHRADLLLLVLYFSGTVRGTTRLSKTLFVSWMESSAPRKIDIQYEFASDHFGPFDRVIYQDVLALKEASLVEKKLPPVRSGGGREKNELGVRERRGKADWIYALTDRGRDVVGTILSASDDPETLAMIEEMRRITIRCSQMSYDGLLRYVYRKYPSFTSRSKIRGQYLDEE